ncbi:hypothetical protein CL652_02130 [bacterium]|nr:hypothetical protein [bacterium]|tara:strand:+ start:26477 stop:27319 length:843 start_codon:yes stop_codon:yes gene_type:complete
MAQSASKRQPSKGKGGGKKSPISWNFVGPQGQRIPVKYDIDKNRWFADGSSKQPRSYLLIEAVQNGKVIGKAGPGGRLIRTDGPKSVPKPKPATPPEEPSKPEEPAPEPESKPTPSAKGGYNMRNFFWGVAGLAFLALIIWAAFGFPGYNQNRTVVQPVATTTTTVVTCGAGTVLRGSSCVAVSPPPSSPASVASRLERGVVADPSLASYQRPVGDPFSSVSSVVRRAAPDGLPAMSRSRWRACLQQLGLLKQCSPRIINGREVIWCSTDAALEQARQCN